MKTALHASIVAVMALVNVTRSYAEGFFTIHEIKIHEKPPVTQPADLVGIWLEKTEATRKSGNPRS